MNNLTKKKLLLISIALLAANMILTIVLARLDTSTYTHLDGTVVQSDNELMRTIIFGQLFSIPIFSVLTGLIVAIFIDRGLPYSKRIVRGFLLTIATIYALFTIMGVIRVLTFA